MTSKFCSGQNVRLLRSLSRKWAADGDYQIVRTLPENAGEPQYRVKSAHEAHERVINESDMETA
jgi:hypothetical protein